MRRRARHRTDFALGDTELYTGNSSAKDICGCPVIKISVREDICSDCLVVQSTFESFKREITLPKMHS